MAVLRYIRTVRERAKPGAINLSTTGDDTDDPVETNTDSNPQRGYYSPDYEVLQEMMTG
jgi:hypothetical protein